MNKHTATYSVFGLSDEKGPQFIKTKQSLFETLILLFSQIEVNDKDWVFDELADDIEEIYGIDVRDEKQLHGLGLILDLNESDNDRVGIDLDCSGDSYLFAKVVEYLTTQYASIFTFGDGYRLKVFGNIANEFDIEFWCESNIWVYAKMD